MAVLRRSKRLHRHPDYRDMVVVDERHRVFFEMVQTSLRQALEKLEAIQFAAMDDEEDDA